jgi:hypothetical protein
MSGTVFWFDLAGQSLGLLGALYTVANPFLTKKEAIEIGAPRFAGDTDEENENLPLVQDIIRQSRKARLGLGLIASGFALQAIATILSR